MKLYLRVLAALYACGGILHCADLLDLRLHFSEMNLVWKIWIVYLAIADLLAAAGLWRLERWGEALFIFIAVLQLFAYTAFRGVFQDQTPLIIFHILTIAVFVVLRRRSRNSDCVLRQEFRNATSSGP